MTVLYFPHYHYGQQKWDRYLIDTHQQIRLSGLSVSAALESVAGEVCDSLEVLGARFEYALGLISDELTQQRRILEEIGQRLHGIDSALRNPLKTRAHELRALGEDHLHRGLLTEALTMFLRAEESNEVDMLVQLYVGKLRLYGVNDSENLVDLARAEVHLAKAIRYAEAHVADLPEARRISGEAAFHRAVACYALASDAHLAADENAPRRWLAESVTSASRAIERRPGWPEPVFHRARCRALLGELDDAAGDLETAVDADRGYAAKAADEPAFQPLAETVARLQETPPRGAAFRSVRVRVDQLERLSTQVIDAVDPLGADHPDVDRVIQQAGELLARLESDMTLNVSAASEQAVAMFGELRQAGHAAFDRAVGEIQKRADPWRRERDRIAALRDNGRPFGGVIWTGIVAMFATPVLVLGIRSDTTADPYWQSELRALAGLIAVIGVVTIVVLALSAPRVSKLVLGAYWASRQFVLDSKVRHYDDQLQSLRAERRRWHHGVKAALGLRE